MRRVYEIDLIPGRIYTYHTKEGATVKFTGERSETVVCFIPVKNKCYGGFVVDDNGRIILGRLDNDVWFENNIKFGR